MASQEFATRLSSLERLSGDRLKTLGLGILTLWFAYAFSLIIYRLYFHPLSKYPGPRLAAITNAYRHVYLLRGTDIHNMLAVHKKYGPVIRYGPNMLLYTDSAAWKDIYGHRTGGREPNAKRQIISTPRFPGHDSIIAADEENHSRQRRIFSNAFSEQSLRKQEPMFRKYVDMLIDNLKAQITEEPERVINLVDYLNFTTFDVMSELTFSEPLGMLLNSEYSPWVKMIFKSIKTSIFSYVTRQYPPISGILRAMLPSKGKKIQEEHYRFSDSRVDRRIEREVDQPDIWKLVLKQEGYRQLTRKEMYSNAELFMIAGTETTATLLSGLTYLLLETPRAMDRLRAELEGAFPDPANDVNVEKLAQLPYLHACIEEALRIYPPAPTVMQRETPRGGNAILGEWIPGNTIVGIGNYAIGHTPSNWAVPEEFWPERWLADRDARFANDQRAAMQAFSIGPRNCLGRNMAYFEIRFIATLLLLNFDIELCPESRNWTDQKTYALWQKNPLLVKLRRRTAAA